MPWTVSIILVFLLLICCLWLWRQNRSLQLRSLSEKPYRDQITVLNQAIEQSPTVVGITDRDGNLTYINAAFEKASGYKSEEVIGQNPRVLKSGVTPDSVYENMWATISAGGTWRGEICNKDKNGQLYWEKAQISGVKDSHNQVTHYLKVADDITAWKKERVAIAEVEKRFRTIFDFSAVGIALLDRQGHWLEVNDCLCQMLDHTPEEMIGRSFLEFTPEKDHQKVADWNQPFESGELSSATIEKQYIKRGGDLIWAEVTATLVRDGLGMAEYFICLITDITRRKEAEEAASRHQNQLAHMERISTLQQMASELAHEIDQPLCAIMSAGQAARRLLGHCQTCTEPDIVEALDLVNEQAVRAGKVVESIRHFSSKTSVRNQIFELEEVVNLTVNLLAGDFKTQGVDLNLIPSPESGLQLQGDPILVQQILVNLLRNGADAMITGQAPVKELVLQWERRKERVLIQVTNSGPPLEKELLDHIFRPFFSTRPEGLGLGLALCQTIVESLSGRLWAEPGEEEGTTFLVDLPLHNGRDE